MVELFCSGYKLANKQCAGPMATDFCGVRLRRVAAKARFTRRVTCGCAAG